MRVDRRSQEDFYERLADYSKTLGIALSTDKFIMKTDEAKLRTYKTDLKRFQNLKASVKLRYAEAIEYRDYEPKIKKLLDTHIQANEVIQLNTPVDILDDHHFDAVKEGRGIYSGRPTVARADTIAHATKKVINEKMDEDPALYEKFSKLIQQAIDDFKARRISDLDYLSKVSKIRDSVASKEHDDVPDSISENDEACAYYGVTRQLFTGYEIAVTDEILCELSLAIQTALEQEKIVDFWYNELAKNKTIGDLCINLPRAALKW